MGSSCILLRTTSDAVKNGALEEGWVREEGTSSTDASDDAVVAASPAAIATSLGAASEEYNVETRQVGE